MLEVFHYTRSGDDVTFSKAHLFVSQEACVSCIFLFKVCRGGGGGFVIKCKRIVVYIHLQHEMFLLTVQLSIKISFYVSQHNFAFLNAPTKPVLNNRMYWIKILVHMFQFMSFWRKRWDLNWKVDFCFSDSFLILLYQDEFAVSR